MLQGLHLVVDVLFCASSCCSLLLVQARRRLVLVLRVTRPWGLLGQPLWTPACCSPSAVRLVQPVDGCRVEQLLEVLGVQRSWDSLRTEAQGPHGVFLPCKAGKPQEQSGTRPHAKAAIITHLVDKRERQAGPSMLEGGQGGCSPPLDL